MNAPCVLPIMLACAPCAFREVDGCDPYVFGQGRKGNDMEVCLRDYLRNDGSWSALREESCEWSALREHRFSANTCFQPADGQRLPPISPLFARRAGETSHRPRPLRHTSHRPVPTRFSTPTQWSRHPMESPLFARRAGGKRSSTMHSSSISKAGGLEGADVMFEPMPMVKAPCASTLTMQTFQAYYLRG